MFPCIREIICGLWRLDVSSYLVKRAAHHSVLQHAILNSIFGRQQYHIHSRHQWVFMYLSLLLEEGKKNLGEIHKEFILVMWLGYGRHNAFFENWLQCVLCTHIFVRTGVLITVEHSLWWQVIKHLWSCLTNATTLPTHRPVIPTINLSPIEL